MRKTLLFVLALMAMPMLVSAYVLTPGYDGTPAYYIGPVAAGDRNYTTLYPGASHFRIDSAQVWLYRAATNAGCTFNVKLYTANGSGAVGDCGCTTAPNTLIKTWGPFSVQNNTAHWYPNWRKVDLVPDTVVAGPFILAIEFATVTNPANWGYLIDYTENQPECCDQYFYLNFGSGYQLYDNEAIVVGDPPNPSGVVYQAAMGVDTGVATPGRLSVSDLEIMGGALPDSTVTDTLILSNTGGTSLTVTNVTSTNPAFAVDPIGAGIVVPAMSSVRWAVNFTPTVAGDYTTTLAFIDNVPETVNVGLSGRGVSLTDLLLFDNIWNLNAGWMEYRLDSLASQDWGFIYNGGHSEGWTNIAFGHEWSSADSFVTDILMAPVMTAPVDPQGGTVTLNFRELVVASDWYFYHGLALADSDTNIYDLTELTVAGDGEWVDYPTTWYITGLDSELSKFSLGFIYQGADADGWYIDDIEIRGVPPAPPIITAADARGDAFDAAQELVLDAFDPNSDPFTVTAYVNTVGYLMTETPAGSGHFCLNFTAFLSGAGTYSYYIEATDVDGTSRFPTAGTYSFDVASQTGSTELIYHDGVWNNAHYYYNMDNEEAVIFTPPSYPWYLSGAKIGILEGWPNLAHEQITVKVYDDDGTSGMPGTVLYTQTTGSIGNECDGLTNYAWYPAMVVFDPPIAITSGSFYVAAKNLSGAVQPAVEAMTFDTLGSGNSYYYNEDSLQWYAYATADGDLMFSALGFAEPAAPVLTIFTDPGNLSASIYVDGVSGGGAIAATNIYVGTSWGAQALLAGSPFTTSPVTYTYGANNVAYFTATRVFGPVELMRSIPPMDPEHPSYTVNVPVRCAVGSAMGAVEFDASAPMTNVLDWNRPTIYTVDESGHVVTAKTIGKSLGKATATTLNPDLRGPVRLTPKNGLTFFSADARVK